MSTNTTSLAKRADRLVHVVNQLIADIDSDISAPGEAAFHARHAYDALCRVDNALRDAIAVSTTRHYEALARESTAGRGMSTRTQASLSLPATVDYTPLHAVTKTRRLPGGRYAAVGALYFMGQRGIYLTGIGETRHEATKSVMYTIQCGKPLPADHSGGVRDSAHDSERRLRAMGG